MEHTSYWIHNLNPIALPLWGNFGIRYYGMAYLLAFLIGYGLLVVFQKKKLLPLTSDQLSNIMLPLLLGVLVGGRIGYMLLYAWADMLRDPLMIFRLWEGGMSSHGGFLGVTLACWWISKNYTIPFLRLGDLLSVMVPPGLFLGRIANFINGELWGKVTTVPWAVIFPQSNTGSVPLALTPPRHPSQLYEAFLEGLVLLLFTQWRLWRTSAVKSPGRLSGEFLILYALVRLLGEQFREPDAALILGLSRGIFYSFFLALGGGYLIWHASRKNST